ncbi:unannotated protein [freshwater metagenome]|uniref:Unannotated protein n=1 Tax=freshwater metagenome TaxID=449393 RepID=A0A6J7TPM9_9ZZZZ
MVPPIAKDGSSAQACKATASIEDVVVLPWVPATAIDLDSDIKIAKAAARVSTFSPSSCARIISGLLVAIAVEYTTRSAPSTLPALCIVDICAPSA